MVSFDALQQVKSARQLGVPSIDLEEGWSEKQAAPEGECEFCVPCAGCDDDDKPSFTSKLW